MSIVEDQGNLKPVFRTKFERQLLDSTSSDDCRSYDLNRVNDNERDRSRKRMRDDSHVRDHQWDARKKPQLEKLDNPDKELSTAIKEEYGFGSNKPKKRAMKPSEKSRLPPITEENEAEGPYAVVMAPTRELAQQIEHETVKFAHFLGIRVVSIVGGQSIEEQAFKIRQGCEVVIGTPGRLIDCLERRYIVLNQCNYVVLDEADRMIDMGFEPQVVGVLDAMPSTNFKPRNEDEELDEKKIYRTTYMFSATMPPVVERLAKKYLRNPVVVTVGTTGKATDLIAQHVIMVKESEKMSRLHKILDELGDKTSIVFVNSKKSADTLYRALDKAHYRVTTIHGGKLQEHREISLEFFRTKKYNVMVATDVVGRGIDIPDVAHVINYDMPANIEMYTHRIGRTGRAGKTGIATTFLTMHDTDVFYDLKHMLIQSNSPVPPELSRLKTRGFKIQAWFHS